MFIVDDQESRTLQIPRDYGSDDVVLIVEDKAFNDDCSLRKRHPFSHG